MTGKRVVATRDNPSVRRDAPSMDRARPLAHQVVVDLGARIRDRRLAAGSRLPTEAALVQRYGVSRTVVREAISSLQASGLVETRHGVGSFVREARDRAVFVLDPNDAAAAVDVMAVLELRISLETDSAALAAERCTSRQVAGMRAALSDFQRDVAAGGGGVAGDVRFHSLIAQATGNAYFVDILATVGSAMIPRTRLSSSVRPDGRAEYLARVNREHEEILAAIERRDVDSARAAMRVHLTNSRDRFSGV